MFLELIATFIAGLASAGIIMLTNKMTGGHLPKWTIPAGAGAGMIALTIWSEYNWYERTANTLPEGMEIAATIENQAFYRPWTYVAPYVTRFAAVDRASIMANPAAPDYRIARVVFMGRWAPVRQVRMLFDCDGNRRVDLVEGVELDDDGLPIDGSPWLRLEADDALLTSACKDVA